jgi:hypothetical protein
MASLGSTLLDVRNRENYIPARAKGERKKQMERWVQTGERGNTVLVMELSIQKKREDY